MREFSKIIFKSSDFSVPEYLINNKYLIKGNFQSTISIVLERGIIWVMEEIILVVNLTVLII